MRSRSRSQSGPNSPREGSNLELVRVRRTQRDTGDAGRELRGRSRRRGGRGRPRKGRPSPSPARHGGFFGWLKRLFGGGAPGRPSTAPRSDQEARTLEDFQRHFELRFNDPDLLKLALTHRSYLSVTGQGPRESNERLEFLGDSVLGLVTSEFLYRRHPDEHEGELTKNKSLLVSKAILSRRALAMGLGRFVLMSHSEVESGGRQRLSILADAFESVLGAIYLDQGFEASRTFIHRWLLREAGEIVADKRHTNYKSHLQEYVQSTWRTHPLYRIRSEMGPDHSKHFLVEVMVGKRTLGTGRGRNKKEAEQAAARDALEKAGVTRDVARAEERDAVDSGRGEERRGREERAAEARAAVLLPEPDEYRETAMAEEGDDDDSDRRRRRGRRGGRGRRGRLEEGAAPMPSPVVEAVTPEREVAPLVSSRLATPSRRLGTLPPGPLEDEVPIEEVEPLPAPHEEEDFEEVGRPVGPHEELHVDPYEVAEGVEPGDAAGDSSWESEPDDEDEDDVDDDEDDEVEVEDDEEVDEDEEDEDLDESATGETWADEPAPARPAEEPRFEPRSSVPPPRSYATPEPFEPPAPEIDAPRSPVPPPAPESPAFGRRRSRR